jgi:hypothetical protein
MHLPLATKAGVPVAALAALDAGQPLLNDLRSGLALARTLARKLFAGHRLGGQTPADAVAQWGEPVWWSCSRWWATSPWRAG